MVSDPQARVVAFLGSSAAWPDVHAPITCIETHGAFVFIAGDTALKVRRAVRLSYLDFSSLDSRKRFSERELELNKRHAPEIYRRVVPLTEDDNGTLSIGGSGRIVEWAVEMARFDESDVLSSVATAGGVDDVLAHDLAEAVFAYHADCPARPEAPDRIPIILQSVMASLGGRGDPTLKEIADRLTALAAPVLARSTAIRGKRRADGFIRRCHGDLHLGNIVLWRGKPVPFDAIEFDEAIATIDTLYDLAFLLMDLDRHGARRAANIVLGRYLWRTGDMRDLAGLAAMPLYLALRAAIRAMVTLDRAKLGVGDNIAQRNEAIGMLRDAERYLQPKPPVLVAVGGLSGSGKTTLARRIAPRLWPTPGAIHLRSDLERKWLAGVGETERLPSSAYTPGASRATYARFAERAAAVLAAGHSVVVDAVFAKPEERRDIEALARRSGAAFKGLWLTSTPDTLKTRVAARSGDASDATPEVVDKQLLYALGDINWTAIDTSGDSDEIEHRALSLLSEK